MPERPMPLGNGGNNLSKVLMQISFTIRQSNLKRGIKEQKIFRCEIQIFCVFVLRHVWVCCESVFPKPNLLSKYVINAMPPLSSSIQDALQNITFQLNRQPNQCIMSFYLQFLKTSESFMIEIFSKNRHSLLGIPQIIETYFLQVLDGNIIFYFIFMYMIFCYNL